MESHSDWRCSVERLDPKKGYMKDNTVLICAEFNSSVQWTVDKVESLRHLLTLKQESVLHVKYNREMKGLTHRRVVSTDTHCICNTCGLEKLLHEFTKRLSAGCNKCRSNSMRLRRSTASGHFSKLLTTMRQASKVRGHPPPSVTQSDLMRILNEQGGLCAYSGIPMRFGSIKQNDWVCSVDRRNVSEGYTITNISLICYEFNTMDMSAMRNKAANGKGSSGWTLMKMNRLKEHWAIPYT